jgi:hypothetical protein
MYAFRAFKPRFSFLGLPPPARPPPPSHRLHIVRFWAENTFSHLVSSSSRFRSLCFTLSIYSCLSISLHVRQAVDARVARFFLTQRTKNAEKCNK